MFTHSGSCLIRDPISIIAKYPSASAERKPQRPITYVKAVPRGGRCIVLNGEALPVSFFHLSQVATHAQVLSISRQHHGHMSCSQCCA